MNQSKENLHSLTYEEYYRNRILENKNNHLTEEILGYYVKYFFGENTIHNKVVPESGIKNRPDYRNDDYMVIFEFDGYRHYNNSKNIIKDKDTTKIWTDMGYTVYRIPYFIQIDKEILFDMFVMCLTENQYYEFMEGFEELPLKDYNKLLPEEYKELSSNYKHGFISSKALLPSDFNSLGYNLFLKYIEDDYYSDDIVESLYYLSKNNPLETIIPLNNDILYNKLQRRINGKNNNGES